MTLFLGSMLFYVLSCGANYYWAGILLLITLLAFFAGFTLVKPGRKWLLGLYLFCILSVLTFFKLYDSGRHLPAGMSFYLFQIAAYLIDISRLKFLPERRLLDFLNQITFFPKLLSGPLMDPRILKMQNKFCRPVKADISEGLQKFIFGLSFKVLIANRLSGLWAQAATVGYESISTPFAWMTIISYAMRLYFDFYGYSLMAMGIGKMLGYELPENFIDPYASKSVSEFYRRWHATLGAWFREYLYIPLGGNRCGTLRNACNLAIVWLFTGLWHGVGGNYLLWAGILFFFILNERLWLSRYLKQTYLFGHIYTVFVILLSWVPFAIGDWDQMLLFFGRLFGQMGSTLNPNDYLIWGESYFGLLLSGALLSTPFPRKIWDQLRGSTLGNLILFVLFWASIYCISTAAQDPFLYFQY